MTGKLILIGGGGHCKACIDVIETNNQYSIAGILDRNKQKGQQVLHYPILGDDAMIDAFADKHPFLVTLGWIKDASARIQLYASIRAIGGVLATIFSSLAYVSRNAQVGDGTIVMHGAYINAGAVVGNNCIINTKALVEHDATIGDHTHISTGAIVNGGCRIGDEVFVGSNAVIVNGVHIASGAIIGAGAIVHRDITKAGVYAGSPARNLGE